MTDPIFAVFDIGLVFSIPIGLAIWQLVVLKRSIRRDRDKASKEAASPPPCGEGSGVGVIPLASTEGHPATPTSNSSPQGGGDTRAFM